MKPIKTYTATIKVTFEIHKEENPRVIAKHMADYYNGMRGANLHVYGAVENIAEENHEKHITNGRTIRKK